MRVEVSWLAFLKLSARLPSTAMPHTPQRLQLAPLPFARRPHRSSFTPNLGFMGHLPHLRRSDLRPDPETRSTSRCGSRWQSRFRHAMSRVFAPMFRFRRSPHADPVVLVALVALIALFTSGSPQREVLQRVSPPATVLTPKSATSPDSSFQPDDAARESPDANLNPPDPAQAMALFKRLEGWVRTGKIEAHPALIERAGRSVGTAVTLRFQGILIGRGVACSDDGLTFVNAARASLEEAARRLPKPLGLAPETNAFVQQLSIQLELSGTLIPISPKTYGELDLQLQRGVEGIAIRYQGDLTAVFPASMIVNDTSPGMALAAAISTASGDPTLALRDNPQSQPPDFTRRTGATIYKFSTQTLAQPTAAQPPTFLFRGHKVISDTEITLPNLRAFAHNLAQYLLRWGSAVSRSPSSTANWPQGTYLPTRDSYAQPAASLAEFAVVTYALHRLMAVEARLGPLAAIDPASSTYSPLFDITPRFNIARVEELRKALDTPQTQAQLRSQLTGPMASCLQALILMSPMEGVKPALRSLPAQLVALDPQLRTVFDPVTGWHEAIPEGARAFAAFVLAKRAMLMEDESGPARETATQAVRSVFRETKPTMLVMHMPWLGWAELTLAEDAAGPVGATGTQRTAVPAAAALRDMRDLIEKFQLTESDAGVEGPDLVGGIVFTSSLQLLPSAHSLRPLAFLATMIGEPRLTDESEKMAHLAKLLSGLRFTRQLALDQSAAWCAVDAPTALWGIRASLWDTRQSPEATALALLAVCNTLDSLTPRETSPRQSK